VRIDVARRRYGPVEEARLHELLGPRSQWGDTLRPLHWSQASVLVPSFADTTVVKLPLTCSVDVTQGPAKLLFALEDGDVPITVHFGGTVFYEAPGGALQVAHIRQDGEARFRLPVELVRRVADLHHAGTAFVPVRRDVFERLHDYRVAGGHATWEQALERLLQCEEGK
jgi:hypothetical protein